jgi:hypothetical protein
MKQRVAEMEAEAQKLRELQAAAEQATEAEADVPMAATDEDKAAADSRSVHVGNASTPLYLLKLYALTRKYTIRLIITLRPRKYRPISKLVE